MFNATIDFSTDQIKNTISNFGIWAPLVYMMIMAIAIVISPIPSLPLAASSGILFGVFLGTLYSLIGAEIGAVAAFLIARHLGKEVLEQLLKTKFNIAKKLDEKYLALIIFVSRLFPIFQFDIISYGSGLTNISLRNFALATFFGMIPMTFLAASLGETFIFGNIILISIVSLVLIIFMIIMPLLIKKYNLFNLKGKLF